MHRLHLYHGRFVLIIAMLGIVGFGSQIAQAESTQSSLVRSPSLIEAVAVPQTPGAVSVTGQVFTPGGEVYVALFDPWAVQQHEPRWVVASDTIHGPNGSLDPALGFSQGGEIEVAFGMAYTIHGPDGSQDPARGFRQVGVEDAESVFEPNGSRDPALGYVPGGANDEIIGSLCGSALMVRAYDAQTTQWSNVLDIDPGC